MPITYLDQPVKTKRKITYLDDQPEQPIQPQQPQTRFQLKSEQPYNNYSYGDALKDTGKTIVNSAADLGKNLVVNPVSHPIETVKAVGSAIAHPIKTAQAVGQYAKDRYGNMDKMAETVSKDPFGFAGDVIGAGQGITGVAKGIVNTSGAIAKGTTKNIGKVKDFSKDAFHRSRPDYLVNDVAPEAHRVFQDKVNQFTPEIESYAKNTLKIPDEVITEIKKSGVNDINAVRQHLGNSTDSIYQKIEKGFTDKSKAVEVAYSKAFENSPKQINGRQTFVQMHKLLREANYIKPNGSLNTIARAEGRNPALGKIVDLYESMKPSNVIVDRIKSGNMPLSKQEFLDTIRNSGKYRPDELTNISKKLGVAEADILQGNVRKIDIAKYLNKEQLNRLGSYNQLPMNSLQWNLLRNNLSSIRKSDGALGGRVGKILDALHNDAETAGLKGIKEARDLARSNFKAQDTIFNKPLMKERKLDNYYKLSHSEKRQLKAMEHYTGTQFIDDLKKVSTGKYLDKLAEGKSLDNFVELVNKASDPKYTVYVRNQLKDMLGPTEADKIIKEVLINRRLRLGGKIVAYGTALKVGGNVLEKF